MTVRQIDLLSYADATFGLLEFAPMDRTDTVAGAWTRMLDVEFMDQRGIVDITDLDLDHHTSLETLAQDSMEFVGGSRVLDFEMDGTDGFPQRSSSIEETVIYGG